MKKQFRNMNVEKDITILIKTFERPKICQYLIDSIRAIYPMISIIVADDSKYPRSYLNATTIAMPHDSGLGYCRNHITRMVETPYLINLDDDMIFTDHTKLEVLLGNLKRWDLDVISTPLVQISRKKKIGSRRLSGLFYINENNHRLGIFKSNKNISQNVISCDCSFAGWFLAKTEVVQNLPWLDTSPIGVEHYDWYLRAKMLSYSIGFLQKGASIAHERTQLGDMKSNVYAIKRKRGQRFLHGWYADWGFTTCTANSLKKAPPNFVKLDVTNPYHHKYRGPEWEFTTTTRKVFIDCGGCHGVSVDYFLSTHFDSNFEIHSFEANPNAMHGYKKFKQNKFVHVYNQAVSNYDGSVDFYPSKHIVGGSLCKSKVNINVDSAIKIESINLSRWIMEKFTIDDYIILKLDIEGGEYDVLETMIKDGSIKLVDKLYIAFHMHKLNEENIEKRHDKIVNVLEQMGFTIHTWPDLDSKARRIARNVIK